jgi:hypothetical protein
MLKSNLAREEVRDISVMNGKVKVTHNPVCKNPRVGKFVRKTSIVTVEGWRVGVEGSVTMSNGTGPIGEGDGCHVAEKGEVVIEVSKQAKECGRVIKA